jgi:Ca2+:H+ antiporter
MSLSRLPRILRWTTAVPVLAVLVLIPTWGRDPVTAVLVVVGLFLAGAVLAAVHHAEVVAHRVGEPFGSLVLAVAVTVIEVALIVTLMVSSDSGTETLARDTVFAAVMITCNGILGLCLLVGTLRRRVADFNAEGTATAFATVLTLATLSLVLPTFTTSRPGPEFSPSQLAFAAVASIALYGLFVVIQTVRHRDYFLPVERRGAADPDEHAAPPTGMAALGSLAWPWSVWPRWSRRRSRTRSTPPARRSRPSGSSSRCWCSCPRPSRPSATRAASACRRASTSPSARPWPASG